MRSWVLSLLIVASLAATGSAAAQEASLPDLESRTRAMRNICMVIGDHMASHPRYDPPGHGEAGTTFQYLYEQKVFAAAGVAPGADPEERNRRIRAMFADDLPSFHCTNTQFDEPRCHSIK